MNELWWKSYLTWLFLALQQQHGDLCDEVGERTA